MVDRRRVPPRRGADVPRACSSTLQPTVLLGPDRHPRTRRRAGRATLVRRPDGCRAAALGGARTAATRPVPVLRRLTTTLICDAIRWRRGRGYDVGRTDERVHRPRRTRSHRSSRRYATRSTSVRRMRALGFCVSIEHAEFMAARFERCRHSRRERVDFTSTATFSAKRRANFEALRTAISTCSSQSTCSTRASICPTVDTVLFLRPTESATSSFSNSAAACGWPTTSRASRCSTSSAARTASFGSTCGIEHLPGSAAGR